MKNTLLNVVFLSTFFVPLIFSGCGQEEIQKPQAANKVSLVHLSDEYELQLALSDFTGDEFNTRSEGHQTSELPFGTLDFSHIIKKITNKNQEYPSYTIRLIPPDEIEHSIEYFIVIGGISGFRGYILQYQTSAEHVANISNPEQFTGYIRLLDFDRRIRAENYFEQGLEVKQQDDSDGRLETVYTNCDCHYESEVVKVEPNGALGGIATVRITGISCTCDQPAELSGQGWGDGGVSYPGQPVGDPDGGGTSGGGSNDYSDGIEDDGLTDEIGIIDDCGPEYEKVNGSCLPKCEEGKLRNADGVCIDEGEAVYNELTDIFNTKKELNDSQENKLKIAFKQVYGLSVHRKFVDLLRNRVKLKYRIDPNQTNPGRYNPTTKEITFRSQNDIEYYTLLEELFHAYQDYVVGLSKFVHSLDKKGVTNFEFEAKLYADITNLANLEYISTISSTFQILGSNDENYLTWLTEITEAHKKYPTWDDMKDKYFHFLQEFEKNSPAYNDPIDLQLIPVTIFDVL